MNLICFSWEPWDLKVNKRSVPLVLALLRNKVVDRALYVNPPLHLSALVRGGDSAANWQRLRFCWPRRSGPVVVFTPCYLLPQRCRKMNGWLGRLQANVLKLILRLRPYVYINTNPMEPELQPAFADAEVECLDMYDDFEQIVSADEIRRGEHTRIRNAVNADAHRADFVIAVNSLLADRFRKMGLRAEVLRNAVDFSMFNRDREPTPEPPVALRALPRPIIGYMTGQVDTRIDWELVDFLRQQRPSWSFVILGPSFNSAIVPESVRSAANVHFAPAVPYPELLDFLSHYSVGMAPMRVNAVGLGSDLLKIYHYLAAGLPVVTTAVGGTDLYGNLIRVATSPNDFLEQLELALRDNTVEVIRRRLDYAQSNSWDARAAEFSHWLTQVLA